MKTLSFKLFTAIYSLLLIINFIWFISGATPLETESPVRMVLGAIVIFLLPGLIWGEILGFRSNHFLETIALSFALTLTIEILLLPIPFFFGSEIGLWVALLFVVCLSGIFILNFKLKAEKELTFINPLFNFFKQPFPLNISTSLILLMLLVISYGTYQWGENLTDISGEKLLHMMFVRYYYSMPMVLNDLGVHQGAPPPNLVQLWEYLIAGWSSLINMDPLPLFYRSRFVIPLLGFSGMYLLIKNIFSNMIKAETIFWGVLIMCLGWFALLQPSNLDWIITGDPFRGVMSFMGTAHHSDAAMDILIALSAGLILATFRNTCWRNISLLAGVLSASFMWHPREFFQAAIYAGIFGITMLLFPHTGKKVMLKKWAVVMGIFVVVATIYFSAMSMLVPPQSQGYDEFIVKETALKYAFLPENLIGIRNLFNFPFHLSLTSSAIPDAILKSDLLPNYFTRNWNFNLWLILSGIAIPLLSFFGKKKDKQLSLFYLLLWFLVLSWNFSMLILIVMTYSEIHITTPRMIYIFSYIIIADAIYLVSQVLYREKARHINLFLFPVLMFGTGLFFCWWRGIGIPYIKPVSVILSILALVSFILIFFPVPKFARINPLSPRVFIVTVLGLFLFFFPILGNSYTKIIPKIIKETRPSIEWFSNNNPLDFSRELIHYIRSLPPKQTFLVNPLGRACVPVYAPQYIAVVPQVIGTVIRDRKAYEDVRNGRHPMFINQNAELKKMALKGNMPPDYKSNFLNWKGPDTISLHDLAKTAAPLTNLGYAGDFKFSRISSRDGNIIRVSPVARSKKGEMVIQFGYSLNKDGFDFNLNPGQEVIFSVSAILSDKTKKPSTIFIQDKTSGWERNSVTINSTIENKYIVGKKIRDGATNVCFGIYWQPDNENSWLEIKDLKIYVVDEFVPDCNSIDHKAVEDWLNRYDVDYILIEKKYYSYLLPYFRWFSEDYDIVFNNQERRELIVHYLGNRPSHI